MNEKGKNRQLKSVVAGQRQSPLFSAWRLSRRPPNQKRLQLQKKRGLAPPGKGTWEKSAKSLPIHWLIYGLLTLTLLFLDFLMVI